MSALKATLPSSPRSRLGHSSGLLPHHNTDHTQGNFKSPCLSHYQTKSYEGRGLPRSIPTLQPRTWGPQEVTETFYFRPYLKPLPRCGPHTTCMAKAVLGKESCTRARVHSKCSESASTMSKPGVFFWVVCFFKRTQSLAHQSPPDNTVLQLFIILAPTMRG